MLTIALPTLRASTRQPGRSFRHRTMMQMGGSIGRTSALKSLKIGNRDTLTRTSSRTSSKFSNLEQSGVTVSLSGKRTGNLQGSVTPNPWACWTSISVAVGSEALPCESYSNQQSGRYGVPPVHEAVKLAGGERRTIGWNIPIRCEPDTPPGSYQVGVSATATTSNDGHG
jgi:hypothetical protein